MLGNYTPVRRRLRHGFTLIELLVVIAVIGVLIGLLLPAVQKVREAANRMKCTSNLHNIGLALHQFHDTHGGLPPGTVLGPFLPLQIPDKVNHASWSFLLPYLEQQALYDRYRFDLDSYDPWNTELQKTLVSVLQCPSVGQTLRETPLGLMPTTDYAPTLGVDPVLAQLGWVDSVGNYEGAMPINRMTRLSEVHDGTSSTILVTEDAGRNRLWQQGHMGDAINIGGGPLDSRYNAIQIQGSTFDGVSRPGPCALNCTNAGEVYSFHQAGANAVFADGSVHLLRAGMDIRILARLITRDGRGSGLGRRLVATNGMNRPRRRTASPRSVMRGSFGEKCDTFTIFRSVIRDMAPISMVESGFSVRGFPVQFSPTTAARPDVVAA
jgi:prepilin-type N-terminal cleavage/methylation domain-containing protein/prepilin-type processing-associated H-X9-DG protein